MLNEGSEMCSGLRLKKDPECADLIVHGRGTSVSCGGSSSACARERKKARLQYKRFIMGSRVGGARGRGGLDLCATQLQHAMQDQRTFKFSRERAMCVDHGAAFHCLGCKVALSLVVGAEPSLRCPEIGESSCFELKQSP